MRRVFFVAATTTAFAMAPFDAAAQRDTATADALFQAGRRLMAEGKYDEACPKLEESQRLDPATGTLVNLGECYEAQGKLASAWSRYNDALASARGNAEREAKIRAKIQSVEPKLARLTIVVPKDVESIPGLEVTKDGVVVGSASWALPLPIDPGVHVIAATATGKKPWTVNVEVKASTNNSASVPILPNEATVEAPAPHASSHSTSEPAARPSASSSSETRPAPDRVAGSSSVLPTMGWITGGLGVVALGGAVVFGFQASSAYEDARAIGSSCTRDTCPKQAQANTDGDTAKNRAILAGVVGGVLVAGGAALIVLGSSSERGTAWLGASPLVGGGSVVLGGTL